MKATKVYNILDENKIPYSKVEHNAVYTIEDMEKLTLNNSDAVAKNLFLKDDKKKSFYLVVLNKDKKVNLKELRTLLNSRPLSFASPDQLRDLLDLESGAVTPLGIINNDQRNVTLVIDTELKKDNLIAVHPNTNTATIWLAYQDLIKLISLYDNPIIETKI